MGKRRIDVGDIGGDFIGNIAGGDIYSEFPDRRGCYYKAANGAKIAVVLGVFLITWLIMIQPTQPFQQAAGGNDFLITPYLLCCCIQIVFITVVIFDIQRRRA
ncbi:hypothetical protein QUF64_09570 [Anaerolineales bacterium HSG6]|nr:hypothetical protein [Anaerolineales bacterium HSG6]